MKGNRDYIAYPFLYDKTDDLRCDFEIITDEISSMTGLLASYIMNDELKAEVLKICEIIYHLNPSLRTFTSITEEEKVYLCEQYQHHLKEVKDEFNKFVLPQGSIAACTAHILRTKCKALVRLVHRYEENNNEADVDSMIYDISNILSNYFFVLALHLNKLDDVKEIEFESRNYK